MKKNNRIFFFMPFFFGMILCNVYGEISSLNLKLKEIEAMALDYSPSYKSAELEEESAYWNAEALKTQLKPRVNLEGSFRYQTEVPEMNIIPGRGAIKMGDNENYSFGPSLQWILWDKGALQLNYAAGVFEYKARQWDKLNIKKQILLDCRKSYFQLLLACEQSVLFMDSIKTALIQYDDIKLNVKTGTKSRMDELSAHQEVLIRKRELSQSRTEIAAALRDLAKLTGLFYPEASTLYPLDSRKRKTTLPDIEPATHFIELEKIEALLKRFEYYRTKNWKEEQPSLLALEERMTALEKTREGIKAQSAPKVSLTAKSSYDYPNGAVAEEVFQNMAGVAVSMPLFEDRQTEKKEKQTEARRRSLEQVKKETISELQKEWNKSQDELRGLEEQEKINTATVKESNELVDIVFKSYQAGSLTHVEVQNANFRALEAESQFVKTQIQILFNLAKLAYLSEEDPQ